MFKKFHLNQDYEFNLNGDYRLRGQLVKSEGVENLMVRVEGFDKPLGLEWLCLISHYEVKCSYSDVMKIFFNKVFSRVLKYRCGHAMAVKGHIDCGKGFRMIPGFPRYGINDTGDVKRLKTGRIISPRIGPYGYPVVGVYDPDKGKHRDVCTHILLAHAFIPNSKPEEQPFVNHIDGNKKNLKIKNLEWVSSSRNNRHAVESRLRKDNKPVIVLDVVSGKTELYDSLVSAFTGIGMAGVKPIHTYVDGVPIRNLFKGRYRLKLVSDCNDWAEADYVVTKKTSSRKGPYETKNTTTGEICVHETIHRVVEYTGVSLDRVSHALRAGPDVLYGSYLFRKKSQNPWPVCVREVRYSKPRTIVSRCLDTEETKTFSSLRATLGHYGLDKRTLQNRLKTGKPYDSFVFIEIF